MNIRYVTRIADLMLDLVLSRGASGSPDPGEESSEAHGRDLAYGVDSNEDGRGREEGLPCAD